MKSEVAQSVHFYGSRDCSLPGSPSVILQAERLGGCHFLLQCKSLSVLLNLVVVDLVLGLSFSVPSLLYL